MFNRIRNLSKTKLFNLLITLSLILGGLHITSQNVYAGYTRGGHDYYLSYNGWSVLVKTYDDAPVRDADGDIVSASMFIGIYGTDWLHVGNIPEITITCENGKVVYGTPSNGISKSVIDYSYNGYNGISFNLTSDNLSTRLSSSNIELKGGAKYISIPGLPPAHVCNSDVYVKPSCTEKGYYYCTGCGEKQSEVPALGHNYVHYGNGYEPASCEKPETIVCSRCNDPTKVEELGAKPALGHDFDDGVITTPATVYSTGVRTFTCKRTDPKCTCGQNGAPYTTVETIPKKHFNIYYGDKPIVAIYLGDKPIYDVRLGDVSFVAD